MSNLPIIVANWKMNLSYEESIKLAKSYIPLGLSASTCEIVIAPSSFVLSDTVKIVSGSGIKVAAQDCSTVSEQGAFTGELSARQIQSAGVEYVLLGHSERRQYFSETYNEINSKLRSALPSGLKIILLISESNEDNLHINTKRQLKHQLHAILYGIDSNNSPIENLIFVYEPMWAVSTSIRHHDPDPAYVDEIAGFIKDYAGAHCAVTSQEITVLYGGSVNNTNFDTYISLKEIDGLVIGSASLDIEIMKEIASKL